jgi:hypothetical protein
MKKFLVILMIFTHSAFAQKPHILARADVAQPFNYPSSCFPTNFSPLILGDALVTRAACFDSKFNNKLIYLTKDNFKIIYETKNENLLTDPVGSDQFVVTAEFNESRVVAINAFGLKEQTSFSYRPIDLNAITSLLSIHYKNETLFLRYRTDESIKLISIDKYFKEKTILETNDRLSYIFVPAINDQGEILVKVKLGLNGDISENATDEIRLIQNNKSRILKTEDNNCKNLRNNVSLNNNGNYIYVCENSLTGAEFISAKERFKLSEGLSAEYFAFYLDDYDHFVFRGKYKEVSGVFKKTKTDLIELFNLHSTIQTDSGIARPEKNNVLRSPIYVNNFGHVALVTGLESFDFPGTTLGEGIILIK